jgi:hypothetical protein
MATVLDVVLPKSNVVLRLLSAQGFNAKDDHKEMLPVYGGNCLSHEAVQPWWQTFH